MCTELELGHIHVPNKNLNTRLGYSPPLSRHQASGKLSALIRRLKINLNRQIGNLNYIHLITPPQWRKHTAVQTESCAYIAPALALYTSTQKL